MVLSAVPNTTGPTLNVCCDLIYSNNALPTMYILELASYSKYHNFMQGITYIWLCMAFPTTHMQRIKQGISNIFMQVIYNYKGVTLLHVTEMSNVMLTYYNRKTIHFHALSC